MKIWDTFKTRNAVLYWTRGASVNIVSVAVFGGDTILMVVCSVSCGRAIRTWCLMVGSFVVHGCQTLPEWWISELELLQTYTTTNHYAETHERAPTPLFCKLVCGCSFAKLYWHFIHFFLFPSGTCRLQDADDPGRAVCQCSWEAPQNDRLAWKLQGTHNIGAICWPLCSEVRNNLGRFFLVNIVQRRQFVFCFSSAESKGTGSAADWAKGTWGWSTLLSTGDLVYQKLLVCSSVL